MKSFARRLRQIIFLASLCFSCYATDAETPYSDLTIGTVAPPRIRIGTKAIVLPDGQWELRVRNEKPVSNDGSNALGDMVTLFFQELKDNRLSRTLELSANTISSRRVSWNELPCKAKGDSYWIESRATAISDQFCLRVTFVTGIVEQERDPLYQTWARGIRSEKIAYSREMPLIAVTRYTNQNFLRMRMAFDPRPFGIQDSQSPQRHLNDWHPEIVQTDSLHEQFYRALVGWAPTFAAALDRTFRFDMNVAPADYGVPDLARHLQR